jgi:hypothetical protein
MRLFVVPLCLFAAGSVRICDREETGGAATPEARAVASAGASADAKASLAAPRIGGSVTRVGSFSVELALHQAGRIEAQVSDAQGKWWQTA